MNLNVLFITRKQIIEILNYSSEISQNFFLLINFYMSLKTLTFKSKNDDKNLSESTKENLEKHT